jgi:hypothetical protein
MARAKNPGRKALPKRGYHIGIASERIQGDAMSLADAFDKAAKLFAEEQSAQGKRVYGVGINAFIEEALRRMPEINEFLKSQEIDPKTP